MKNTITKLLCAAMIVCLLLVFAACGNAGTYVLKEVYYAGVTVDAEDAGMDPDDYYLELKSNGTGVMCLDGTEYDMEWEDGEIWEEGDEDNKIDFEIDGKELTIEVEGVEMIFEKE